MTLRSTVLVCALLTASAFAMQRSAPPDLAQDRFKGVTTDGTLQPGLFAIRSTGVTTRPVIEAAAAFPAALTPDQRKRPTFPVDDVEWRRWNNIHRAARAGIAFEKMSEEQRNRGYRLLQAGLSARGLEKTRNDMKLNHRSRRSPTTSRNTARGSTTSP